MKIYVLLVVAFWVFSSPAFADGSQSWVQCLVQPTGGGDSGGGIRDTKPIQDRIVSGISFNEKTPVVFEGVKLVLLSIRENPDLLEHCLEQFPDETRSLQAWFIRSVDQPEVETVGFNEPETVPFKRFFSLSRTSPPLFGPRGMDEFHRRVCESDLPTLSERGYINRNGQPCYLEYSFLGTSLAEAVEMVLVDFFEAEEPVGSWREASLPSEWGR